MAERVWPKLPIMWGRETLTTLMSMTARKVPAITATVTTYCCPRDAGRSCRRGLGVAAPARMTLSPSSVSWLCTAGTTARSGGAQRLAPGGVDDPLAQDTPHACDAGAGGVPRTAAACHVTRYQPARARRVPGTPYQDMPYHAMQGRDRVPHKVYGLPLRFGEIYYARLYFLC